MRDPHVEALVYRAKAPEGFVYHDPPALESETEHFRLRLHDGRLRVEPKQHFATLEEVLPDVERFVKAWMVLSNLDRGFPEIAFEYESAELVDRIPPPPGVIEGHGVTVAGRATVSATATVVSNRFAYPEAPTAFMATPDVETLWNRYLLGPPIRATLRGPGSVPLSGRLRPAPVGTAAASDTPARSGERWCCSRGSRPGSARARRPPRTGRRRRGSRA